MISTRTLCAIILLVCVSGCSGFGRRAPVVVVAGDDTVPIYKSDLLVMEQMLTEQQRRLIECGCP